MKLFMALVSTLVVFAATNARAACELSIDRTACPGKEEAAFKPYNGKNPTAETTKATSAETCLKDAEKASKIIRKGTLSKKVVTASYDGKELGKPSDEKACQ